MALCTLKLLTKAFNDGIQLRDTLYLQTVMSSDFHYSFFYILASKSLTVAFWLTYLCYYCPHSPESLSISQKLKKGNQIEISIVIVSRLKEPYSIEESVLYTEWMLH